MADRKRVKQFMEAVFLPAADVAAEHRTANALDYIAYHMGQIDKNLSEINDAVRVIAQRS